MTNYPLHKVRRAFPAALLPGEHFTEITRKLRRKTRQFYNQRRHGKALPGFSNSRILTQSHLAFHTWVWVVHESRAWPYKQLFQKFNVCLVHSVCILHVLIYLKSWEKKENTRGEQNWKKKPKTNNKIPQKKNEGAPFICCELIPKRQQKPVSWAPGIHYNIKHNKGNLWVASHMPHSFSIKITGYLEFILLIPMSSYTSLKHISIFRI